MRWVASDAVFKRSPEWFRLPSSVQSTHDNLERYCGSQRNWGIIRDCRDWKNGWWQSAAGATRQRIKRQLELGLCRWVDAGLHSPEGPPSVTPSPEGPHLEVLHYDQEGQLKAHRTSTLQSYRAQIRWRSEMEALAKRLNSDRIPIQTQQPSGAKTDALSDPKSAFQADLGDAAASPMASTMAHAFRTAPHRTAPQSGSGSGKGEAGSGPSLPPSNQDPAGRGEGGGERWRAGFEKLRKRYPEDRRFGRAANVSRDAALAAFVALALAEDELGELLEDVDRRKRSRKFVNGYAPWLANYLRTYREKLEDARRRKSKDAPKSKPAAKSNGVAAPDPRATWPAKGGDA